MDDAIVPSQQPTVQVRPQVSHCPYCGGQLIPELYFCPSCATPHSSIEQVITPAEPLRLTDEERVRLRAPQVWRLFWVYLGVVLGVAITGLFFGSRATQVWLLLGSAALFVTTCIYAIRYWPSLAVQFKRTGLLRWETYAALGLLVVALGVNYVWHGLLLRDVIGIDAADPFDTLRADGMTSVALFFLVCLLPGVTEEIAFRGLVQQWLVTAIRPWRAIILASALFMALHFSIYSAPYLFGVGMLLGWVKWRTGSLWPPMILHTLHNFLVIEVLFR